MRGWRTFAVQLGTGLFGLAETLDWTAVLGSQNSGYLLIALAIINAGLRAITTTPPGKAD